MISTLVLLILLGEPGTGADAGVPRVVTVPCTKDQDCKTAERLQSQAYKYICDVVPGAKTGFCIQGCRTDQDCRQRPNASQAAVCRPICTDRNRQDLFKCQFWDCYEPARLKGQ